MCGLAGIFNFRGRPIDPVVLESMSRCLAHRGPDDHGLILLDTAPDEARPDPAKATGCNLGLASRRLAILDLSPAGRMPLANEDKSIHVVFNGEIYNYRELRTELKSLGHQFKTGTDTEVIVHAYEEWGLDCQNRFNGMWAFALYDHRKRRLFCSRDRMGVKPFYYYHNDQVFVFASEIKALLEHPGVPRRPSPRAMFNYLARSYRFVDSRPTTFFEDLRQIEPGGYLLITADGLTFNDYWRLDPAHTTQYSSEAEYVDHYLDLLRNSVRLRLRSDVPLACQLSGGLDSSVVACLAAKQLGPGLPVFSACYDEPPFDETEYIRPTAGRIRAEAHRIYPQPDALLEVLPRIIRLFDEPVCTVTFYAHWQVMSAVRQKGYRVILNGHGADELTAGYYDHFLHHFGDLRTQGANGDLSREVEAWLTRHGRQRAEQMKEYFRIMDHGIPYMEAYLKRFAPYENCLTPEFLAQGLNDQSNPEPFGSRLSNRLYQELRFETLPAVLKAEDRTTMAHAIESRLPFLDYRLVEYAFSIPNQLKIRNGLGKYIQRRALVGLIPEKVRARAEKVGFNAPSEKWFRGELRQPLESAWRSACLFERGVLSRPGFERIWAEHQSGTANHYQFLWQVLNLDLWLKAYFG